MHRPQGSRQGGGQLLQKHSAVPGVQRLRQGKVRSSFGGQQAYLRGFGLPGRRGTGAGRSLCAGLARRQKYLIGFGQRGLQAAFAFAQRPFCLGQAAFGKLRRVHGAGSVRQVVRLVNEKQPVPGGIKKALQMHHRVKQIIVVANDYIAPLAQVQPQLKGAHRKLPGSLCQRGAAEAAAAIQQSGQRVLAAVVIAVCKGTYFRQTGGVALGVRVQAGLFLGGQGHAAQGKAGLCSTQPRDRVLGGGLGGVAGGQVEQLCAAARAHGLQGREEGTHGLADAGRRLTKDAGAALAVGAFPGAAGAVHLARQCPLPGAVFRKGELQRRKAPAAQGVPLQLPLRPRGVLR